MKQVAAEVLKINPFAFETVIGELADLDLIRNVKRQAGEVISFTEHVPLTHDDMHERLGQNWALKHPSELEAKFVAAVDILAQAPLPVELLRLEIDADERVDSLLRAVGEGAELVRHYRLQDGTEIAASPLYAFEQPDKLVNVFERHQADLVRDAFSRLRRQPGFPLLMNGTDLVEEDMVRLGLVPAPTVVGADQQQRSFAVVPYGLHPSYLTSKKQVLEKALAIIACVRCGEVSGGMTRIIFPDKLLQRLMDPTRIYTLGGHSSTERQYAPLIRMGVIRAVVVEGLRAAQLIATADNLEAVELARTLLRRRGEGLPERGDEHRAADLLFTGGSYLVPIETIAAARRKAPALDPNKLMELWGQIAWGIQ